MDSPINLKKSLRDRMEGAGLGDSFVAPAPMPGPARPPTGTWRQLPPETPGGPTFTKQWTPEERAMQQKALVEILRGLR